MSTAILLLSCPDQPGIVAAVSGFVADRGGNIVQAEQYTDSESGMFFQRVQFTLENFSLGRTDIEPAFRPVAERFDMTTNLGFERHAVSDLPSWRPKSLIACMT